MVYGLEVESVSEDEEDDTEQGGEDMEVCSDDENAQDNLIEVNVRRQDQHQYSNLLLP